MSRKQCFYCGDPAGGRWSPLFCESCDEKRMARIGRNLDDLKKYLEDKELEQKEIGA